jgi:hypothetical protein
LAKTGGRKKGVPNKLNGTISDMLRRLGCDPGAILARIAMNPKNSAELRRKCAADLLPFLHPRLSAVDTNVTGETQTIVQIVTGIARLPTDPIVDVTPLPPALSDNSGSPSAGDSVTTSPALAAPAAYTEVFDSAASTLPPGRPWSPAPAETGPSAPLSILPGRFDPKSDEVIDRERSADSKIAELNSRAAKFVA